jgi:uncharacterized protein (DUF1330 family)
VISGSLVPSAGAPLTTDLDLCGLTQIDVAPTCVRAACAIFFKQEQIMNRIIVLGIGMLAGIAIGAGAVNGLNAQGKGPGAYAIVDIGEINDPATFQTLLPKAAAANDAFGGKFLARTENIVPLDGTPPKRFVVIAFDSIDKAKAWDNSPSQAEVNAIRKKTTKSRTFLVDGELQ